MPGPESRVRTPDDARDPLEGWGTRPATRGEVEELRAKLNLLEYGGITADKLSGGTVGHHKIQLASDGQIFAADSDGNGFTLDDEGLAFFDGGVTTIYLSANGGTAFFKGNIDASTITGGTIRTAASGSRIVLSDADVDTIAFYTGHASETEPGAIFSSTGSTTLALSLFSPKAGHEWASLQVGGRTAAAPGARGYCDISVLNSSNAVLSRISIDSGLLYGQAPTASFLIGGGSIDLVHVPSTNTFQIRWLGPTSGDVAIGVDGPGTGDRLNVQSFDATTPLPISASAFTVVSRQADKVDIKERTTPVLAKLRRLRAVDYTRPAYKSKHRDGKEVDAPASKYTGFLAEEMMTQFPEAVVNNGEGEPHSIDLMAVVAILCQGIQELALKENN